MTNLISLKILTPEKVVYQDDVKKIVVPTESGEIGILPDHSPLVSIVKTGELKIEKESNNIIPFSISSGIIEVRPSSNSNKKNSEVVILASRSELATEIDIERAEEAYNRAKKAMEETDNISDVDFAKFQAILDKELNRVKIAKKYRK
ncbi:MAG: ATP synthase F1 subunit epsilon [Candidatus Pacebacteria bacterium]|nr:ATP synthase F1 subunit epsilon [Candidatus Paceibacterota bacterium]